MLVLSALGIAVFNAALYLAAQSTTALNIVMLQTTVPVLIVFASYMLFRDRGDETAGGRHRHLAGRRADADHRMAIQPC